MDGWLRRIAGGLALLLLSPAIGARDAFEDPGTLIPDPREAAPGLQRLGEAPFGERIDFATGEVVFHQVDIELVGTGPTIRIARTRSAEGDAGRDPTAAFGDWRLDVPRLETTLASGVDVGNAWRLGPAMDADSLARCSRFDAPHGRDAAWDGYALQLGDGVRHAVLKRSPDWTVRPGLPGAFPAVTTSEVHIGCLPETRNGEPGEAFLAVAPDGVRYRLDRLIGGTAEAGKMRAAMLATRVEDRFGNWVDYRYEGGLVQSILASDGREVVFEWEGDRITRITTHPGSDAPRTWRYEYAGKTLAAVVLPDGSRWSFDMHATQGASLTTPSGLTGRFVFGPRWDGRRSLVQRTWAGPGVDARWEYVHGPAPQASQWVDVFGPDGSRVRETFSTATDAREGKLLRRETFAADGTSLRSERFDYAMADAGFVARVGDAMLDAGMNAASLETRVPLRERVISQQGRDFTWRATRFDAFGRANVVERVGTHARIERTTYADHLDAWVLAQVASTTQTDPDTGDTIEPLRIDFDPKSALPLRRFVRGLLQETRTYHADGTLASRSDGRDTPALDTTIRYGGWMRGIPTSVTFPGGVRKRAGVEVDGTITWVAGETGARTCFAYDPIGRRVRTIWPAESEATRCGDDHWNETFASFAQSPVATPLLAAGHWTRTERTGNGVRTIWYDALWRPVLEEEHDTANIAGTRRTTRIAHDAAGRETFRSYPSALPIPAQEGITTHYDALGRTVRVEQSSELGPLATTFESLDDFQLRAINPRGAATTIERFRAYDAPDDAFPESVAYPEGLHVDIERDAFDQPRRISHRNTEGTFAVSTRYVHDTHGRLCKTIAPERGATVIGRDNAGNVTWTVAGSALDDPDACQHAEAYASGRRVDRTWDARNRLATLAFPDGIGNRAHAWTADGLPSRITTWNIPAGRIVINTYAWNARRLPVREGLTHPGIDTWDLGTTYNRNGHATVLAYPNGTGIGLVPDALGQPTYVGSYANNVRWHPDGSLAQFTYNNGLVHTTTRNARGLPERRRDAYGATAFFDESLDYDANGNLAAISDGLPAASGDRVLAHDALDRLARVDAPLFETAHYQRDPVGRLSRLSIGGPHARTHHFCRDALGRVTNVKIVDCASGPSVIGIERDAAGSLVRMNAQSFAYDAGHRLRSVEGIERYEYDGHDRRIRATSLQGQGDILSQYDRAGRLMWQNDHRREVGKLFLHLGGRLIAVREQALSGGVATLRFLHSDVEGTPVVETGLDRALLRQIAHEPYGLLLEGEPRDGVGFRAQVSDANTGLLYSPTGYTHPRLPERLNACGWNNLGEPPALDATRLLRAPPTRDC